MPTNRVNKYSEELARLAAESTAALPPASEGSFIGTSGGRLKFKGADVPGNKLDVVVLDFSAENQFYEGAYDPNNPESPVCYAWGNDPKTIKPHEKAPDPQAESCAACPHNQWGSGGKGKACKNVMRLALLPADAAKDAENTEVAWLKVPVMSVKNFSLYASSLQRDLGLPPCGVVTRITTTPDPKSQFRILFETVRELNAEELGPVLGKRKTIQIDFPYPERTAAEPPARSARSGATPARSFQGSSRSRKL